MINKSDNIKNRYRVALRKAFSLLLPLFVLSLFISGTICSISNDIYAFVKKDGEINLSIDQSCSVKEFSKILKENGVINNPNIFSLYITSKKKQKTVENFTGDIALNSSMSYREILANIS